MTTIVIGDVVKLTGRYAKALMKTSRSKNKVDWYSRRGIARVINRSEVFVAWPGRITLDAVPHAGVEKA